MTVQRGKTYLETGRTLLRTAQTMIDSVIAGRLKALADDCQWQAEKVFASRFTQSIGSIGCRELKVSGIYDLRGRFIAQSSEEMPGDVGTPGARPRSLAFYSFVIARTASKLELRYQIGME